MSPENYPATDPQTSWRSNVKTVLQVIGTFVLFLFSIDLMISSLQHLGYAVTEAILLATANPFNGLFIGLLITAMLQSSSTSTSLVVALVASGAITLDNAIPIIFGANVGTTITSTIVSLGFINSKKEFRRAVAAGTYHDFFNILTVMVLFPLEYYNGFLSRSSQKIAAAFFSSYVPTEKVSTPFASGFHPVIDFLLKVIPSSLLLALLALALLFSSILIFRKVISDLLKVKRPEVFSRFFFKSPLKSFSWGVLITAAIRSSTITTSVVVPIVAKKIVTLKQAAPFIMGANIGTTITAFIAAILNANSLSAISISLVHFLFNITGVLLFFPIPFLRKIPAALANGLGKLTLRYRLAGFVYLLSAFFFIPFTLIYFNQGSIQTLNLTYEQTGASGSLTHYRLTARTNLRTHQGEWTKYPGLEPVTGEAPSAIYPVYMKSKTLFVGNQMILFNRPGFCWDGEENDRQYRACIESVQSDFTIANTQFDSVYVFRVQYLQQNDSNLHRYYYSASHNIMLMHEMISQGETRVLEKLISFEKR